MLPILNAYTWSVIAAGALVVLLSGLIIATGLLLLRRGADRGLLALAGLACLAALVFAPLDRSLPEPLGLPFFMIGLFPILAAIAVAVLASAARLLQSRRWLPLADLLLSLAAAGLWWINFSTPWLWAYAKL